MTTCSGWQRDKERKENGMEITIKGESKEIAALVLAVQERRVMDNLASDIAIRLQAALGQNEPVFQP